MEELKEYGKVEEELQYIEFTLADKKFCLLIDDVEEIVKPSKVESVPLAHPFIQGVTTLRGDVLPVINLKKVLDLPEEDKKENRFIVLSQTIGRIALSVDQVAQIFSAASPENLENEILYVSKKVKSGDESVYLLDVRQLLEDLKTESMS